MLQHQEDEQQRREDALQQEKSEPLARTLEQEEKNNVHDLVVSTSTSEQSPLTGNRFEGLGEDYQEEFPHVSISDLGAATWQVVRSKKSKVKTISDSTSELADAARKICESSVLTRRR